MLQQQKCYNNSKLQHQQNDKTNNNSNNITKVNVQNKIDNNKNNNSYNNNNKNNVTKANNNCVDRANVAATNCLGTAWITVKQHVAIEATPTILTTTKSTRVAAATTQSIKTFKQVSVNVVAAIKQAQQQQQQQQKNSTKTNSAAKQQKTICQIEHKIVSSSSSNNNNNRNMLQQIVEIENEMTTKTIASFNDNHNNKNNSNNVNNTTNSRLAKIVAAIMPLKPTTTANTTTTRSTSNTNDKTIDFNSRRRRGRLRSATLPLTPTIQKTAICCHEIAWSAKATNIKIAVENVAKRSIIWLSLLLLSLIVQYVNIIKTFYLVLTKTKSTTTPTAATKYHQHEDEQYENISKNKIINVYAEIENDKDKTDDIVDNFVKSKNSTVQRKSCNNNSNNYKWKKSISDNCCRNIQSVYAFLLCLTLCLQCGNNLVAAAKPKSATQLQQQLQQFHKNQEQQQQENVAFDGERSGVGVPPTYEVVPSDKWDDETQDSYAFDDEEEFRSNQNEEMTSTLHNNETGSANFTIPVIPKTPLFPTDLFTKEQLEKGAVACHIIGVMYMFVALAIVCDEFFVPSLDVIIEKLGITDDVAGATFMAAGGSAPELFTSVIGVFVSFDDVGIGTIVGSAVFNILFVIGMCALFSRTVLSLTWWPLFRDCSFYSLSLLVLIYFFRDNRIYWWEALILFSIYCAYVTFMKWNVQVESCVKKMISKNKPGGSVTSRAASESRSGPPGSSSAGATGNSSGTAGSTQTGAKFRHGLLQLMIHTIDPLHDGKVDEKATQLHAIASLKVLLDATKPQRGGATTSAANHVKINLKETTLADRPNGNIDTTLDSPSLSGRRPSWIEQRVKIQTRKFSIKQTQEVEDEPEPLSMAWPDTARKRITYILVAPLLIPMWLTLPDTRTPRGKRFYPVTFIGSIMWIAAFSYLMVWWANVAGDTARIPPEVMGLTFLAAGTSIPDLITSVIVARKGFGDMAVSSSVGSNIFDVTVGLPIPWLLYGLIYDAPVEVNSVGMVCSITILFMMLVFVVLSIACFGWRMNKGLGFTMFLLYFVFVAVSLMFEYDVLSCPV